MLSYFTSSLAARVIAKALAFLHLVVYKITERLNPFTLKLLLIESAAAHLNNPHCLGRKLNIVEHGREWPRFDADRRVTFSVTTRNGKRLDLPVVLIQKVPA